MLSRDVFFPCFYFYLLVYSLYLVLLLSFGVILGVHKVGWAGSWTGERGHLELAFRSDMLYGFFVWLELNGLDWEEGRAGLLVWRDFNNGLLRVYVSYE